MSNQVFEQEQQIQSYLLDGYYTLIAPSNPNLFNEFIKYANNAIPGWSIHDVLSNRDEVKKLLSNFKQSIEIRVYVIYGKEDSFIVHHTIEDYCKRNNIDLEF